MLALNKYTSRCSSLLLHLKWAVAGYKAKGLAQ